MSDATEIGGLLQAALVRHSDRSLAEMLGMTEKRLALVVKDPPSSQVLGDTLRNIMNGHLRVKAKFRTVDLFAGIGGIRLAFEAVGGGCVYSAEWNKYARQTYVANFGADHRIDGDITKIDAKSVPDHDVLLAGFPCQPFSIAGVSKKNSLGRSHGFKDKTQGTLFFDVARIIAAKRPAAFLLENVKNLTRHDKGRTFATIMEVLQEDLGYNVFTKVIDAKPFVPQHRERVIIVGFREPVGLSWDDLVIPAGGPTLGSILHPEDGTELPSPYTVGKNGDVDPRFTLSGHLWKYLRDYAAKHKAAGNGFGFGLVDGNSVTRTLSARYHKDGSEILVSRGRRRNPRRLTPRECARLMGYPETFVIPVSDTQAYRQFGNSVVVPVIGAVAELMLPEILRATKIADPCAA